MPYASAKQQRAYHATGGWKRPVKAPAAVRAAKAQQKRRKQR